MGLIHKTSVLLPSSAAEIYVCPTDIVTNRLNFSFVNLDTVVRAVSIWIVPSGQSVGDAYEVIGMESASAKLIPGGQRSYPLNQVLTAGDKIFWAADAADVVAAHLDISEVDAAGITVDGFTRLYACVNTGYLPNTLTEAYEVPANAQILQMELLVHNKDSAVQAIAARAVPEGEDSGDNQWIIVSNPAHQHLAPGESRVMQLEHFLTGGYTVHWRALNSSVVIGRLSIELIEL
jgi:hypothetical protein